VALPAGSYEFSVPGTQTHAYFSVGSDGAVAVKDPVIVSGGDHHLSLNVVSIDLDENGFKGLWGFEHILRDPACKPTLLPLGTMWYFTLGESVLTAVTTDRFGHVFVANPETYRFSPANRFILNTEMILVQPEGKAKSLAWTIVQTEAAGPKIGSRYVGLIPNNTDSFAWIEGDQTKMVKFRYPERCTIEPNAIDIGGGSFNLGAPCKNIVQDWRKSEK